MKSIIKYIYEQYEDFSVKDVNVTYNIIGTNSSNSIYIKAPAKYSESNIQTYLDDVVLQKLPSSKDLSEKYFGANASNIYDAYFKYDGFGHSKTYNYDVDLEWDSHHDTTINDEDLEYFKLTNLKYVISFEKFDLKKENTDNLKSIMEQIFKATESNDANKYPLTIKYSDVIYTEE